MFSTLELTLTCVVCIHEYWLNENTENGLIRFEDLQCILQERVHSRKKMRRSAVIYKNNKEYRKSNIIYASSCSGIDCMVVVIQNIALLWN